MNDELADRIEALEAERLRPVPPSPRRRRVRPAEVRPDGPAIAKARRKALYEATRPRTAGRRPDHEEGGARAA